MTLDGEWGTFFTRFFYARRSSVVGGGFGFRVVKRIVEGEGKRRVVEPE